MSTHGGWVGGGAYQRPYGTIWRERVWGGGGLSLLTYVYE